MPHTLTDILALPELIEMRRDIQRLTQAAACEHRLSDDWYYLHHTGEPAPKTEALLLQDLTAAYTDRVNELCHQNGLPDYIISHGPARRG